MPEAGTALTWWYLLAAAAGYLLGSIPFGLVLTRTAGLGDIRRLGSGNIGATNVLRTGSKALAAATVVLDGGKGAVAVLALAPWDAGLVAGFAAVIGHNFPVWLRFRGGKGVATTLGVLLAVAWPVGLLACLTWLVVAAGQLGPPAIPFAPIFNSCPLSRRRMLAWWRTMASTVRAAARPMRGPSASHCMVNGVAMIATRAASEE